MRVIFLLVVASCVAYQQLPLNYTLRSVAGARAGMCPDTQDLREAIEQDIHSLINSSVLSVLGTGPGYGACGYGNPGWRRAAYLNMSDPTQTCPPAWELITTPRDPVLDLLVLPVRPVIQLCSILLRAFNTLRSVEESLDINLDIHKHSILVKGALLMNNMLME